MEKPANRQQRAAIAERRAKTKRRRTVGSIAVGLAAAAGLSAWAIKESHDDTAAPSVISCEAPNADSWRGMPLNINASAIARGLEISEDQVRRGSYGPAACEQAVSPDDISSGPVLLIIKNVGNTCMAIGLQTEVLEASNNVLAVCAAPEN